MLGHRIEMYIFSASKAISSIISVNSWAAKKIMRISTNFEELFLTPTVDSHPKDTGKYLSVDTETEDRTSWPEEEFTRLLVRVRVLKYFRRL